MTEAIASTQEMAPETALHQLMDVVCSRGRTHIAPEELKGDILNLCISLRVKTDALPAALQELHTEAGRRMKGDDRSIGFDIDSVVQTIMSVIADTPR